MAHLPFEGGANRGGGRPGRVLCAKGSRLRNSNWCPEPRKVAADGYPFVDGPTVNGSTPQAKMGMAYEASAYGSSTRHFVGVYDPDVHNGGVSWEYIIKETPFAFLGPSYRDYILYPRPVPGP